MSSNAAQHAIERSMTVNASPGPPGNPHLPLPTVVPHPQPAPTTVLHAYRVIDEAVVDQTLKSSPFRSYKIHECLKCRKQFGDLLSARLHAHTHLGTRRPLECTGCNAKFTEKTSAKRHVDNREKRFHCDFCRKRFARHDYLVSHRRNCARRVLA